MVDDPTSSHPQPPMQTRPIAPPGHTSEMPQQPDHGEHSYKGSDRLLGRAAIITGADSGIGRAVAIAFAREGADVLISYLNEHEDAEQTAHKSTRAPSPTPTATASATCRASPPGCPTWSAWAWTPCGCPLFTAGPRLVD